MYSCEISKIFKEAYIEEHLPRDASITERQQETHALLGKKNESHFTKHMARAMNVYRKLHLLKFDSVLYCSTLSLWIMNLWW